MNSRKSALFVYLMLFTSAQQLIRWADIANVVLFSMFI